MSLFAALPFDWHRAGVDWLARSLSTPNHTVALFEVRAVLAVLFVGLACGVVGSLVVGNRMAFFSDAMSHTAYAGVACAVLAIMLTTGATTTRQVGEYQWLVPWAMCLVGAAAGLTIAVVRETTGLANDTVIGVFFAFALGVAAVLIPALRQRVNFDLEGFLFGQLHFIDDDDLVNLAALAAVTAGAVAWRYNSLVFGSFNPSLGKSRGLAVRANNYLFIVLLALVVNLSVRAVGILLINALLVVPAAAAANVSRNLRRMFWFTLLGCLACGCYGNWLSTRLAIPLGGGGPVQPGPAGTIVCVCVGWFFASIGLKAVRKRFFGANLPAAPCARDHGDGQYPHTH